MAAQIVNGNRDLYTFALSAGFTERAEAKADDKAVCIHCKQRKSVCCDDGARDEPGGTVYQNPSCADCCNHPKVNVPVLNRSEW